MSSDFSVTKYRKNWYFTSQAALAVKGTGVSIFWKTARRTFKPYCNPTHKAMTAIKRALSRGDIHPDVLADFRHLDDLTKKREDVIRILETVRKVDKEFTMPWAPAGYKYPPKGPYQGEAIRALSQVPFVLLQADCGLGKTYMSIHGLWARRWLAERRSDTPPRALVLCPLSLITGAWGDDVEKLCNDDIQMFDLRRYWKSRSKKKGPVPQDKAIYVTNYESLPNHMDDILAMNFDIMILDESSRCKTPNIATTKNVMTLADNIPVRWLLTGTPMPNGIRDIWQQARIMDGGCTVGASHMEFMLATHHAIHGGALRRDGTPNNLPVGQVIYQETRQGMDLVRSRLQPVTLRYEKSLLDLPERTFIDSMVDPSAKQLKLMNQMREELIAELDSGEIITLSNAMVKMAKLLQVSGGFIIDQEYAVQEDGSFRGDLHALKTNPKIDRTLDLIEGIDGQVIIWAWFRHEVEAITKAINNSKNISGNAVFLHGGVSDKMREDRRLGFKSGKYKYLVANHRLLSHGHTFVNCNYAIYYSNSFDAELYSQSKDRIHRIGQENPCFYYHIIMRNSIDRYILNALQYKEGVQAYVTNIKRLRAVLEAA